jgi:hypothetical protein
MTKQINYKGFAILKREDSWPQFEVEFERIPGQYWDEWDGSGEYSSLQAAKKAKLCKK